MLLPEPRQPGQYRIGIVCLGNICRSPMADVVLSDRIERAHLSSAVTVASSGTGAWHVGKPMDARAADLLRSRGYDPSRHRARLFDPTWFERFDLILAMDAANHREVLTQGDAARVRMFRDFDPETTDSDNEHPEVPDPYYGGVDGYVLVLDIVERTTDSLVSQLVGHLDRTGG